MKSLSQLADDEIKRNAVPSLNEARLHGRVEGMDWSERFKFIMTSGTRLELSECQDDVQFSVPIRTMLPGQHIRINTPIITGFRNELIKKAA